MAQVLEDLRSNASSTYTHTQKKKKKKKKERERRKTMHAVPDNTNHLTGPEE
jgi:hypothetical protein